MTIEDASNINRAGAQISFFTNDGKPISNESIYNEVQFAPPNQDSFLAIRMIRTIHTEVPKDDPIYNVSTYEGLVSQIALLTPANDSFGNLASEIVNSKQQLVFLLHSKL